MTLHPVWRCNRSAERPVFLLAQAAGGGGIAAMSNMLLPVFLIGIFYFILIRPQQSGSVSLKTGASRSKGDEIITSGPVGTGFVV